LYCHYQLWEPWPRAGPLPLHFPVTDRPETAPLDSRGSWVLPVPVAYEVPPGEVPRLYLGSALADGQPIEVHADAQPGEAGATWRGHFGLLGEAAGTEATLAAVMAGARRHGISVVHIHTSGPRPGHHAAGSNEHLIDLDAPGVSLHWNLLTTSPFTDADAGERAIALRLLLSHPIPLLGAAVAQGGLIGASSGPGWAMLLDAARLLTIHHYREQAVGEADTVPPPTLRAVYDLLTDPDGLIALATHETDLWDAEHFTAGAEDNEPSKPVDDPTKSLVRHLLRDANARLTKSSAAERRQTAAGVCNRLSPLVCHPRLAAWWDEPLSAPGAVLNTTPGTLIDIRLPPGGDESARLAADRYGLYLLACLIALAAERVLFGHPHPPVLLVLEDGIAWWRGALIHNHLPLLAQAGIAVLTSSPHLPADPLGSQWLDTTGSWWLHRLDPADAARLEPWLRAWGVPGEPALTGLPPGIALLKLAGSQGPIVTTVRPADPEEVP
jgi:hypothetical protein